MQVSGQSLGHEHMWFSGSYLLFDTNLSISMSLDLEDAAEATSPQLLQDGVRCPCRLGCGSMCHVVNDAWIVGNVTMVW